MSLHRLKVLAAATALGSSLIVVGCSSSTGDHTMPMSTPAASEPSGAASPPASASPPAGASASASASAAPSGSAAPSAAPASPSASGSASAAGSSTPAGGSSTPVAGPFNNADVLFAQRMIPHHEQAVKMADLIVAKDGIDADLTALARQIKKAQAPEITQLSGWLAGWGESTHAGMGHDMGGGMMSEAELRKLEQARGNEAARLFLTGMTQHHRGAIAMAEEELKNGQNPEVKRLAQHISDTQQAEIAQMGTLLDQL